MSGMSTGRQMFKTKKKTPLAADEPKLSSSCDASSAMSRRTSNAARVSHTYGRGGSSVRRPWDARWTNKEGSGVGAHLHEVWRQRLAGGPFQYCSGQVHCLRCAEGVSR